MLIESILLLRILLKLFKEQLLVIWFILILHMIMKKEDLHHILAMASPEMICTG